MWNPRLSLPSSRKSAGGLEARGSLTVPYARERERASERERARESERERGRARERDRGEGPRAREKERVCVCRKARRKESKKERKNERKERKKDKKRERKTERESLSPQHTNVQTPHPNNMLEGVRLERGVWGLPTPHPRSKAKQRERERERENALARGLQGWTTLGLLPGRERERERENGTLRLCQRGATTRLREPCRGVTRAKVTNGGSTSTAGWTRRTCQAQRPRTKCGSSQDDEEVRPQEDDAVLPQVSRAATQPGKNRGPEDSSHRRRRFHAVMLDD